MSMYVWIGLILLVFVIVALVFRFVHNRRKLKVEEGASAKNTSSFTDARDVSKSNHKALLVGINKYSPELNADLRGCVNDVEFMRSLLISKYGFNPDDIRVVTDERATKASIIERLEWLVSVSKPGDEVVFHYSGHGSQVRDRHGDELSDGLDEIICPYDLNWDDPITDDLLAEIFAKLPEGVNFTMISDSCHSGTMLRDVRDTASCSANGTTNPNYNKAKFIMPPFDIRSRGWAGNLLKRTMRTQLKLGPTVEKYVLLSGCKDDQTSADAFIESKYMGALTWALTKTLNDSPDLSWKEVQQSVYTMVRSNGYTQEPQISGFEPLLTRKVFGGAQSYN